MNTVKLSRHTPATLFEIRFPIWNGGKRVVGLALDRLTKHNEVRILYTRKADGVRIYPDNYYVDGDLAKIFFNRMTVANGRELVLIPIESLQKLERAA